MRINSYNKFFAEVAKIMNTDVKDVKQIDGRYKVELANHVYLNVYRGVSGSLFIHDHRGIAHITSCYDFEDFKTMKDLYERLITDYGETADTATEKHYDDYTSEDFINAGIAKECTECPDFCIKNVECAKGNDVFEGCKTVKDVMEVKNELNTRYGKEQYFDTDSLQPNKKIIAKIENINCCPKRNTCCFVTPYANCDYNYKSDSCIKAYNYFIHDCEQMHKHMKARSNPEWHHVNLETVRNIDNDMLDEKRRLYIKVYRMTANVINSIYKCNKLTSIDKLRTNLMQTVRTMAKNEKIEWALVQYVKAKIDNCYLVNGLQSSFYSKTYGYNKSRSYTKTFFI